MSKKTDYANQWIKENTIRFTLRFTYNSGIPVALSNMYTLTGEKPMEYIRRVVTESLIFDGFLEEKLKHPDDQK